MRTVDADEWAIDPVAMDSSKVRADSAPSGEFDAKGKRSQLKVASWIRKIADSSSEESDSDSLHLDDSSGSDEEGSSNTLLQKQRYLDSLLKKKGLR
jgi:hypothetical protein